MSPDNMREHFTLAFTGPGTEDHSMNVEVLASSVGALSRMVRRMNYLLNGNRVRIQLRVSGFQPGSFEVPLFLEEASRWAAVLGVDGGASIRLMMDILLGTKRHMGLLQLLKALKGRPVNVIEDKVNKDNEILASQLEIDGLVVEVGPETTKLAADRLVRKEFRNVTKGLREHNLEGVSFGQEGLESTALTPEDIADEYVMLGRAESASLPDAEEVRRFRQRLTIMEIQFGAVSANRVVRWKLHDGSTARQYVIKDAEFLNRVRLGVQFGLGDVLLCNVEVRQWTTRSGDRKTETSVDQVLQHTKPGWQPRLEES